ncbi:hypothetical protein N2152v2_003399 [Parachlorella kessleri]
MALRSFNRSARRVRALEVRAEVAADTERALTPAGSPASPDDVVIVHARRTALCKANTGGFKNTPVDELVFAVLKDAVDQTGIDPAEVGDVVMGSVMCQSSKRANEIRMAMLVTGIPDSVPVYTVNRQCASGLQAIANVAYSIRIGQYDVGIAGGVESMTTNPMMLEWGTINPHMAENPEAMDCLLPMGLTSENVAEQFGITREEQDELAAESHVRAGTARDTGRFSDEIIPVPTLWKDPKSGSEVHATVDHDDGIYPLDPGFDPFDTAGSEVHLTVDHDDGIHPEFTAKKLARHHPVFKKGGSTTVGNSSQVTDGAAACVLMTRAEAEKRGLKPLGRLLSFTAVGVPPGIMGIGPAVAIPKAVKMAGLKVEDINLFELNEAFASQAKYCQKVLNIDSSIVNVNGGAIALGHPLGCTGARLTVTLLHEMQKRGKDCRFGVVSMCMASGMGAAGVFEQEQS